MDEIRLQRKKKLSCLLELMLAGFVSIVALSVGITILGPMFQKIVIGSAGMGLK